MQKSSTEGRRITKPSAEQFKTPLAGKRLKRNINVNDKILVEYLIAIRDTFMPNESSQIRIIPDRCICNATNSHVILSTLTIPNVIPAAIEVINKLAKNNPK